MRAGLTFSPPPRAFVVAPLLALAVAATTATGAARTPMTLQQLVDPTSVFVDQEQPVKFALYGFIEFQSLEELFAYIDQQAGKWRFETPQERNAFADRLLKKGLESRVVSMVYAKPREVLVTHTKAELAAAIERLRTAEPGLIYRGANWSVGADSFRDLFLALRERWVSSLNCWSASPSIAARVLSNWYVIEEGIPLFGATYDSTEHFWQAIKYHPEVSLKEVSELLKRVRSIDWAPWLRSLKDDQQTYLENTYAIEFLSHNLTSEKLLWFQSEVDKYVGPFPGTARAVQQRAAGTPWKLRFTPFEEKVLWGDLADVFHLIHYFGQLDRGLKIPKMEPVLRDLTLHHFDAVYLDGYEGGRVGFISPEYQRLMLEIWKVKFLRMDRFREVLRSTGGFRLLHFLNDGDSPDIPIPIYVGFLQRIREMALEGS